MMYKARRKPATVCLTAAVILTCCLVQTIDCLRLKKTGRRITQRETNAATATGVQEGKIVFGEVSEKEPQVTDGTRKTPSNASVDDEAAYQADFPGLLKVTADDSAYMDKWNRLGTSLYCFGDHMKFRSLGPGASQFSVMQDKSPLPLSMVPRKCGYRMHGNALVFVMMIPYDGCNVVQQGGSYKLPLHWQGKPVSLLCPKHVVTTAQKLHNYWPQNYYDYQGQVMPQLPPVPVMPPAPQLPPVPVMPPAPQLPPIPVMPPAPQLPPVPVMPPAPQLPPVPVMPPAPQVPSDQLPQVNVLSHPLYHLYDAGAEHGGYLPKFPLYPQQPYHFLAPPEGEPMTAAPKVVLPQVPFQLYYPWGYGPQFPNYMPAFPHVPQVQYPENGVPDMKSTAAPYTPAPTGPSTTDSPTEGPLNYYSPEHYPFLPYEHMYHPYQG